MDIVNLAFAALLAATMSAPAATAQLMNYRRIKNRRHARLQHDARRARMRELVDAMSLPPTTAPPTPPVPVPPTTLEPTPARPATTPPTASPDAQPATSAPTTPEPVPTDFPTLEPTTLPPTPTPGNPTKKPNTRKPTRKPTTKPTRKPTKEPGSDRSYDNCEPYDGEVTVERYDGVEFHFKWNETYGSCVDYEDRLYEYGEFYNVASFANCAAACLQDVDEKLTKTTVLRGFDYVCESEKGGLYYYEGKCRCLYDSGTLDVDSRAAKQTDFDKTSYAGNGAGPVDGTSTEEERTSSGNTLKTLCGAIVDHFDEYEHVVEIAYY